MYPSILNIEAKRWYEFNADFRFYHNLYHANAVVSALPPDSKDSVVLAAMWHDAVYIPGAMYGANEEASAAALQFTWNQCGLDRDSEILLQAKEFIRRTSVEWHLVEHNYLGESSPDLASLLDADVSSLAASYDSFVTNQKNILKENGLEINRINLRKSAAFLNQFLEKRPHIYHTRYARDRWEEPARLNIKTFTEGLEDV